MTVDGFNRRLHPDQEKILASLAPNDPDKQAELKRVLCLEQNCAFDKNGLVSDEARNLQRAGYDLRSNDPERYEQLLGVIHEAKLLDGPFEYGDMARIGDAAGAAWVAGAGNRAVSGNSPAFFPSPCPTQTLASQFITGGETHGRGTQGQVAAA
jgi:hypothetical protein